MNQAVIIGTAVRFSKSIGESCDIPAYNITSPAIGLMVRPN